ncbi:uncharacterized protein LOC134244861 [Saccostrea cucullata]|uniref:uncharacterized protein LOC134244861 n=1 Tax=Saccostrea cuccullata TaxID=36930 RepID=UPI002ED0E3C5
MSEGKTTTEFDYGNGYINVFIPRADGTIVDPRKFPPPSPVFTLEHIYKFSEDVKRDRHLFLDRKPYFHGFFGESLEQLRDDVSRGGDSNQNSIERDNNANVNVVKLSIDASTKAIPRIRDKRFNERLSAYVRKNAAVEKAETTDHSVKESKTLAEKANNILQKSPTQNLTPRRPKIRRGLTFHTVSPTKMSTVQLPRLNASTPSFSKQNTMLTLNTERTMWFPDYVIEKTYNKFGLGRPPIRPSSKPSKIWRQSTALLQRDKISVMNRARSVEVYRTNKQTSNINNIQREQTTA